MRSYKWNELHELKTLLIYKKITERYDEKDKLCEEFSKDPFFVQAGIPLSSIKMKIQNIIYLDTSGLKGLSNVANLTKEIWQKYKDTSIQDLEQIIYEKCPDENMICDDVRWKKEVVDRLDRLEKSVYSTSASFITRKEINMNESDKITHDLSEKIKYQMLKTFKHLKQTDLIKSKQQSYYSKTNQIALCIKISKLHSANDSHWYTLTSTEKEFLEGFKNSYVFLGFRDNEKIAYLIPFFEYREDFLRCNQSTAGWHININHKLQWCVSGMRKIELSLFEQSLDLEPKKVA